MKKENQHIHAWKEKALKAFLKCFAVSLLGIVSCGKSEDSVNTLYKFPDTKDIQVQVQIEYKLESKGGPAVATRDQAFYLNAFLFDGNDTQVQIAPVGSIPVTNLPVTLSSTNLSFDAVLRIPASAQAGDSGYDFYFKLVENNSALSLTDETETTSSTVANLEALKGGVQPGTAAGDNVVPLSLATTLAYQITKDAGFAGSANHVSTYESLISTVADRLKIVENTIDPSSTPSLAVFAAAVLAGVKLQIMQDQSLQSSLNSVLQPALVIAKGETASSTLASAFTQILKNFSTEVKNTLGSSNTAESKIFTAGTIDPASIPEPTSYVSIIFAPAAVAFTDNDATATIGGNIVITPPASVTGVASYNIYFGGETLSSGRGKLLGNVLKNANPLSLTLPNKTVLPSQYSRFWVYPVSSEKELDLATSVVIVNVGGTGGAPAAPTSVAATIGKNQVRITWESVEGATSYNIYWSLLETVSTASNRILGVSSPYVHRGLRTDVQYYYLVTAVKGNLESPTSAVASASQSTSSPTPSPSSKPTPTPTPASRAPSVPTLTGTAASSTQINLAWTNISGSTVVIAYQQGPTAPANCALGASIANSSPYQVTNLNPGTTYSFTICLTTSSAALANATSITTLSNTQTTPKSSTSAPGSGSSDMFGCAVAIAGDKALIGSGVIDGNFDGEAYAFKFASGAWSLQQTLSPPDSGVSFGAAIGMTQSRAVIGSSGWGGGSRNVAYYYEYNNSNNQWEIKHTFTGTAAAGYAVAIDDSYVVIGNPADSGSSGADIYTGSGNTWTLERSISENPYDQLFGTSIALTDTHIFIGSPKKSMNGSYGSVFVYSKANLATAPAEVTEASNVFFGKSIAAEQDTLVVGDPFFNNSWDGKAFVYTLQSGTWTKTQTLTPSTSSAHFGEGVAINGKMLFVGEPDAASGGQNGAGITRVYRYANGSWSLSDTIEATSPVAGSGLGANMAIKGNSLLLGTWKMIDMGRTPGANVNALFVDTNQVN